MSEFSKMKTEKLPQFGEKRKSKALIDISKIQWLKDPLTLQKDLKRKK